MRQFVACERVAQASGLNPARNGVPKLTDAQLRVMKWLGHGWEGQPGGGSAVMVNGQRICNVDTMTSLARAGLVRQDELRCWKATEDGRALVERLSL